LNLEILLSLIVSNTSKKSKNSILYTFEKVRTLLNLPIESYINEGYTITCKPMRNNELHLFSKHLRV